MSENLTNTNKIDEELEKAEEITETLAPPKTAKAPREEILDRIDEIESTLRSLTTDHALAEVYGLGGLHPNPHVRHEILEIAPEHANNVFARNFIQTLTHDDEDFVAFKAIDLCGELQLQESCDDLVGILGSPSEAAKKITKPVGVGRAKVVDAMFEVFGTRDPDELERLSDHVDEHRHLPLNRLSKPSVSFDPVDADEETLRENAPDGMVLVPGGTYTFGVDEDDLPFQRFYDEDDFTTPYEMELEPFYVDKHPVTNEEYDEFVEWTEENGHKYCHPGEPRDKDHRRNTHHDQRLGDDHPVTGIDWYDAYAYAKWAGKDIPTEEEWEAAARGKSGNLFPWGDEWDSERLNWAGRVFDTEFESLDDWTDHLANADHFAYEELETLTTPVDAFPEGASECGALDMVGNLWEYTKTNFFSRQEICPLLNHPSPNSHENLMKDPRAHPVIRGGAWSTIPEMNTTVFRTKDLMTDRHNEIGFRCIKRPGR